MCYISLRLTAVMCLIVPPSAVAAVLYGRYIRKLSKRTQKAVGELTHVAEERISAVRTVHAFNAIETQETKRFQTQVDKIVRAPIRALADTTSSRSPRPRRTRLGSSSGPSRSHGGRTDQASGAGLSVRLGHSSYGRVARHALYPA